jgi:hypothetical protein
MTDRPPLARFVLGQPIVSGGQLASPCSCAWVKDLQPCGSPPARGSDLLHKVISVGLTEVGTCYCLSEHKGMDTLLPYTRCSIQLDSTNSRGTRHGERLKEPSTSTDGGNSMHSAPLGSQVSSLLTQAIDQRATFLEDSTNTGDAYATYLQVQEPDGSAAFSPNETQLTCSGCQNSDPTKFVEDPQCADVICVKCGFVVEKQKNERTKQIPQCAGTCWSRSSGNCVGDLRYLGKTSIEYGCHLPGVPCAGAGVAKNVSEMYVILARPQSNTAAMQIKPVGISDYYSIIDTTPLNLFDVLIVA